MTNLRYFADTAAGVVEFSRVDNRNQSLKMNDCWGYANGEWIKVNRVVAYKANPSKHECDDRCFNATGRTMKCECACGGKNHGKGAFLGEAA